MRKYFNKIRELVEVNIMTRTVMLLLVTIIEYSFSQTIHTIYLSVLIQVVHRLLLITFASTLIHCQTNCLSDNNCRTVTCNQLNKRDSIFVS